MKKFKRGYTLVELMIVIAIIGTFLMVIGGSVMMCAVGNSSSAQLDARQWAQQMGLDVQGVTCADRDTDGDGYVSCSVGVKQKDGNVRIEPVECARKFSWNTGCRSPKAVINSGR